LSANPANISNALKPVHKRIWTSDPSLRSSSWYRKQLAFYVNQSHSKPWFYCFFCQFQKR